VQVHHGEGVATRTGPEPCVGTREGVGEASVGEHIGQPLSCENLKQFGCRRVRFHGKQHGRARQRECPVRPGVVEDPGMCGSSLYGNREVSGLARGWTPRVRIGKTRSRSR
jgi:hypothetical protein